MKAFVHSGPASEVFDSLRKHFGISENSDEILLSALQINEFTVLGKKLTIIAEPAVMRAIIDNPILMARAAMEAGVL